MLPLQGQLLHFQQPPHPHASGTFTSFVSDEPQSLRNLCFCTLFGQIFRFVLATTTFLTSDFSTTMLRVIWFVSAILAMPPYPRASPSDGQIPLCEHDG